jgi:hypothetical protein
MSALRAPDSGPLTLRREISQGIARRRDGNLSVDQKKNPRRLSLLRSLLRVTV